MGINTSGSIETPIIGVIDRNLGLILQGINWTRSLLIKQPSFLAFKQRKKSINPQDSIETRVQ